MALCYETYRVTRDLAWLRQIYPAIVLGMRGIRLTIQSDHLTFAKPDHKVKYLMDNVEVRFGLRAGAAIARVLQTPEAEVWEGFVEENRVGLRGLWLQAEGRFSMAMYEDGSLHMDFAEWYPDGMANAMGLAYILYPDDSKARDLCQLLRETFPDVSDYYLFSALWKFGYKDEAIAMRAEIGSKSAHSVDKGLYIRSFCPEKDEFFYASDFLLLPDLEVT
jgi:hypothetical protein